MVALGWLLEQYNGCAATWPVANKKPLKINRHAVNPRALQFFQFAMAGTVGFMVDAGIVVCLRRFTPIDLVSAKLVGFSVAVTVTWLINRNVAFTAHADARLLREWMRYVWANGLGGIVNNGVYIVAVFTRQELAQHPEFAVAMGSLAGMLFNYSAARWWVFRRTEKERV
jgi:putative flippase GtrA